MIYLLPQFISLIIFIIILHKKNKSDFFYLHFSLLLIFCSILQFQILLNSEYYKLNDFLRISIFLFSVFGLPLLISFSYKLYLKRNKIKSTQ